MPYDHHGRLDEDERPFLIASPGFVPIALAGSTGAEVQKPPAIVVIGGLFGITALTRFVRPPVYRLIGMTRLRSDTAHPDAR
ncbi:MAG: efflux RND transporter permease subunit [Methylotetracoccus sp.]